MIDFNMNIRLSIGSNYDSETSTSLLSRLKGRLSNLYTYGVDIVDYLANDVDTNYRFTYSDGKDAYEILYNRNYPEGIYHNEHNFDEYFYKVYDMQGNAVAGFVIHESSEIGTVQRMEGQQIVATQTPKSKSHAEIYLTNCDEAGFDPYIPLKIEFSEKGIGFIWYGRNSRFTVIPEYFEEFEASLELEREYVEEWLDNYLEEEIDPIHLNVINQINEIEQAKSRRKYTRRKNTSNA